MAADQKISKIVQIALDIEAEEAQRAGTLGFMGRPFLQATLPHSRKPGSEYSRQNGALRMHVLTPEFLGIPYGRYPRLLLSWVSTEAVRTKSSRLELGPSLSSFMAELGLIPTGGRWGTITRLRQQMQSLFSSSILVTWDQPQDGYYKHQGGAVAEEQELWWDPKSADQAALWGSWVGLGRKFYEAVTERPIPIDTRVLKTLRSPLALDLYCWLTYRMSYLRKPTLIPWELLHGQFGADYGRVRAFKEKTLIQLQNVLTVYPAARIEESSEGLRLLPSPSHVRRAK